MNSIQKKRIHHGTTPNPNKAAIVASLLICYSILCHIYVYVFAHIQLQYITIIYTWNDICRDRWDDEVEFAGQAIFPEA